MGRAIVGVVVGYVATFATILLTFGGPYLLLGQGLSFRPGRYEPSLLWTVVSFALGSGAAVLGGYVCAWIARTPPKVLATGLLSARGWAGTRLRKWSLRQIRVGLAIGAG